MYIQGIPHRIVTLISVLLWKMAAIGMVQMLIEAAEYLERRERGKVYCFLQSMLCTRTITITPLPLNHANVCKLFSILLQAALYFFLHPSNRSHAFINAMNFAHQSINQYSDIFGKYCTHKKHVHLPFFDE